MSSPYTFYLHDGPEAMPSFEIELLDSRDQAIAHARGLLKRSSRYTEVLITEGDDEGARLTRESAALH